MTRLQWLVERCGKRVYRNIGCDCCICREQFERGLLIEWNQIPRIVELEERTGIKYFDTKEEAINYKSEKK